MFLNSLLPSLPGLIALVVFSALFIPQQSLWSDEVTQMAGLTLAPVEVAKWLAGKDWFRFGVMGDGHPPLSYWLGWIWVQSFGLTETSMRYFGLFFSSLTLLTTGVLARRISGPIGQCVACLVFGLSPNMITLGVEIRSYPVFMFFSALAFLAFFLVVDRPTTGRFAFWAAAMIAASYTHFFAGFLAAGLLSCGIVVFRDRTRRPERSF